MMKAKKKKGSLPFPQLSENDEGQTYQSDLADHHQCSASEHGNEKTEEISAAEMFQMLEENMVPGLDHLNIFSFLMLFRKF
jgi:hypothetical protein